MNAWKWQAKRNAEAKIRFIRGRAGTSLRKLRLLCCACYRKVWHLIREAQARAAIEVAERYADGTATEAELDAVFSVLRNLSGESWTAGRYSASPDPTDGPSGALWVDHAVWHAKQLFITDWRNPENMFQKGGDQAVSRLILCIFGNPFRSAPFDPDWRTSTVLGLASTIYADRAFDRLPILADALEDAGCDDQDMLTHCRIDPEHARGCWVVDLILGKN